MAKQKYLGLVGEKNNVMVSKPYKGKPEKVKEIRDRLAKATQKSAEQFRKAHRTSAFLIKHYEERRKRCEEQLRKFLVGVTLKFPKGNKISYGQDHGFWEGIPHNVEFVIESLLSIDDDGVKLALSAPGYGGKPYGNGKIFVTFKDMETEMILK